MMSDEFRLTRGQWLGCSVAR